MSEQPYPVGAKVCVKGYGISAPVHKHTKVERYTKTQLVTVTGHKFRLGGRLRSVPYNEYSGFDIQPLEQCAEWKRQERLKKPWAMPDWMKEYEHFIINTDGHNIEKLVNTWRDTETINQLKRDEPRLYAAAVQVVAQLRLLENLKKEDRLK